MAQNAKANIERLTGNRPSLPAAVGGGDSSHGSYGKASRHSLDTRGLLDFVNDDIQRR
ncbi:hypothetical protein IMZ48_26295 [Candidatus Bathyarchaeota archaeon]|nr:hypothetical protein [Candidatus Bathyarchaeota archaeon]